MEAKNINYRLSYAQAFKPSNTANEKFGSCIYQVKLSSLGTSLAQ